MSIARKTTASGHRAEYRGILVIGDPHIEGRQPGFRCDNYPEVILEKIRWCLEYAGSHRLLPVFTGDLFDKPRDNPTWMIGELIDLLMGRETIGIFGNHDCGGTALDEHDSLSILVKSGCLTLVSHDRPWLGNMNHRTVMIGGSSWRRRIPVRVELPVSQSLLEKKPLVIWLTHHDIDIPGYDGGRLAPFEIENVDLLVNGHIHRSLPDVVCGQTRWLTPGNISRRSRSEAVRDHVPSALRIDITSDAILLEPVPIPHRPASDVFHPVVMEVNDHQSTSQFVDGLRELQMRRTDTGAGLHQFLEQNLGQFETTVASEIRKLARHVTVMENEDVEL